MNKSTNYLEDICSLHYLKMETSTVPDISKSEQ